MYHEEIITSTPGIMDKVINSPQVLFAAEAYFIALSHTLEELTDVQIDARKSKLDVLQGKFMEIFMGAANGAFRDYWEQQDQKKQPVSDKAFPQSPASPLKPAAARPPSSKTHRVMDAVSSSCSSG